MPIVEEGFNKMLDASLRTKDAYLAILAGNREPTPSKNYYRIDLPDEVTNPKGIDFDVDKNLYVVDSGTNHYYHGIRIPETKSNLQYFFQRLPLPSGVTNVSGIFVAEDYRVHIVDAATKSRYYTVNLGEWKAEKYLPERLIINLPDELTSPQDISTDSSGNIYIVDNGTNSIFKRTGTDWAKLIDLPSAAVDARGMAVSANGNTIYISDNKTRKIYTYTSSRWNNGTNYPTGVLSIECLTSDSSGNLYTADQLSNKFYKRTGSTWDEGTEFPLETVNPRGIALDNDDNVIIADNHAKKLHTYINGKWFNFINYPNVDFNTVGLARDKRDTEVFLYMLHEDDTEKIPVYTYAEWSDPIPLPSGVDNPSGLTRDSDKEFYITDSRTGKIYNPDHWEDIGLIDNAPVDIDIEEGRLHVLTGGSYSSYDFDTVSRRAKHVETTSVPSEVGDAIAFSVAGDKIFFLDGSTNKVFGKDLWYEDITPPAGTSIFDTEVISANTIMLGDSRTRKIYQGPGGTADWTDQIPLNREYPVNLPPRSLQPVGIARDDNNIYILDAGRDKYYNHPNDPYWDSAEDLPAGVSGPAGLGIDNSGNLYYVDKDTQLYYKRTGTTWDSGNKLAIVNDIELFDYPYAYEKLTEKVYEWDGTDWGNGVDPSRTDFISFTGNQEYFLTSNAYYQDNTKTDLPSSITDPIDITAFQNPVTNSAEVYVADGNTEQIYKHSKEFIGKDLYDNPMNPGSLTYTNGRLYCLDVTLGKIFSTDRSEFAWSQAMDLPTGVTSVRDIDIDSSGNVYLLSTGSLPTAGPPNLKFYKRTGTNWDTGTDIPRPTLSSGDSTQLSGIAVDSSGNVYVSYWLLKGSTAEQRGNTTDIIYRYDGTSWDSGTSTPFTFITGIATDSSDNLVAITGGVGVDKFYKRTGSTWDAGTDLPFQTDNFTPVTIDENDNIIIVNQNVIYKQDGTDFNVFPTNPPGINYYLGIAVSSSGYIDVVGSATGTDINLYSMVDPWSVVSFDTPTGVSGNRIGSYSNGNIILVDQTTSKIYERVGNEWSNTTIDLPAALTEPRGIAADANDNIVVVDDATDKFYTASPVFETVLIDSYSSGTEVDYPTGVTDPRDIFSDDSDNIIVVDAATDKFYTRSSNNWDSGVDLLSSITNPRGIIQDTSGDIHILDAGTNKIYQATRRSYVDITATSDSGTDLPDSVTNPEGIARTSDGNIVIVDNDTNKIFELADQWIELNLPTAVTSPQGIVVDSSDNYVVLDGTTNKIYTATVARNKIYIQNTQQDSNIINIPDNINNDGPRGVFRTSNGDFYVVTYSNKIYKRTGNTWGNPISGPVTIREDQGIGPGGIAVDSSGNIYILSRSYDQASNTRTNRIFKRTGTTWDTGINAPLPSLDDELGGLTIDNNGNLVVLQGKNYYVRTGNSWGSANAITPLATGFEDPSGITIDSDGNVYVTAIDSNTGINILFKKTGNTWTKIINDTLFSFQGLASDIEGNIYGLTAGNIFTISEVSRPSINSWDSGTNIPSGVSRPRGMDIDSAGNIYIIADDDFGFITHIYKRTGSTWSTFVSGPGSTDLNALAIDGSGNIYVYNNTQKIIRIYRRSTGSWDDLHGIDPARPKFGAAIPVNITTDIQGIYAIGIGELLAVGRQDQDISAGPSKYYNLNITRENRFVYNWDSGNDLPSGVNDPQGLTYDGTDLYIVDATTDKIYSKPPDGPTINTGDLYYLDSSRKFYQRTNGVWSSNDLPNVITSAQGIAVDSTGKVYVIDAGTDKFYIWDGTTWDSGNDLPADVTVPRGITIDIEDNIYITDSSNDRVYKRTGNTWDSGIALPSNINTSRGVTVDIEGNLYIIANVHNPTGPRSFIFKYENGAWDSGIPFSQDPSEEFLTGLTIDSEGTIYVVREGTTTISIYRNGTWQRRTLAGPSASTSNAAGLHFRIIKSGDWDSGIDLPTTLTNPTGIAIDSSDNVVVSDSATDKVYTHASGTWNSGLDLPSNLNNIQGITIDSSNNLIVSDNGTDSFFTLIRDSEQRISGYEWDDGVDLVFAGVTTPVPVGLDIDSEGNIIVAHVGLRYFTWDGTSWDNGVRTPRGLFQPSNITDLEGITVDENDNIILLDKATNQYYEEETGWHTSIDFPAAATNVRSIGVHTNGLALYLLDEGTSSFYSIIAAPRPIWRTVAALPTGVTDPRGITFTGGRREGGLGVVISDNATKKVYNYLQRRWNELTDTVQLIEPTGIDFDDNKVYVVDDLSNRYYTKTGNSWDTYPSGGTNAVDNSTGIYVSNGSVTVSNGNPIGVTSNNYSAHSTYFTRPNDEDRYDYPSRVDDIRGIASRRLDDVYIVDNATNKIYRHWHHWTENDLDSRIRDPKAMTYEDNKLYITDGNSKKYYYKDLTDDTWSDPVDIPSNLNNITGMDVHEGNVIIVDATLDRFYEKLLDMEWCPFDLGKLMTDPAGIFYVRDSGSPAKEAIVLNKSTNRFYKWIRDWSGIDAPVSSNPKGLVVNDDINITIVDNTPAPNNDKVYTREFYSWDAGTDLPGVSNVNNISLGSSDKLYVVQDNKDPFDDIVYRIEDSTTKTRIAPITSPVDKKVIAVDASNDKLYSVYKPNRFVEFQGVREIALPTGVTAPQGIYYNQGDYITRALYLVDSRTNKFYIYWKNMPFADPTWSDGVKIPDGVSPSAICHADIDDNSIVFVVDDNSNKIYYSVESTKDDPYGEIMPGAYDPTDIFIHNIAYRRLKITPKQWSGAFTPAADPTSDDVIVKSSITELQRARLPFTAEHISRSDASKAGTFIITPSAGAEFGPAPANWGTIDKVRIYDAVVGGNILMEFDVPRTTVPEKYKITVPGGELKYTLTTS